MLHRLFYFICLINFFKITYSQEVCSLKELTSVYFAKHALNVCNENLNEGIDYAFNAMESDLLEKNIPEEMIYKLIYYAMFSNLQNSGIFLNKIVQEYKLNKSSIIYNKICKEIKFSILKKLIFKEIEEEDETLDIVIFLIKSDKDLEFYNELTNYFSKHIADFKSAYETFQHLSQNAYYTQDIKEYNKILSNINKIKRKIKLFQDIIAVIIGELTPIFENIEAIDQINIDIHEDIKNKGILLIELFNKNDKLSALNLIRSDYHLDIDKILEYIYGVYFIKNFDEGKIFAFMHFLFEKDEFNDNIHNIFIKLNNYYSQSNKIIYIDQLLLYHANPKTKMLAKLRNHILDYKVDKIFYKIKNKDIEDCIEVESELILCYKNLGIEFLYDLLHYLTEYVYKYTSTYAVERLDNLQRLKKIFQNILKKEIENLNFLIPLNIIIDEMIEELEKILDFERKRIVSL